MSLGILAGHRPRPMQGLGAWSSTIPGECWDQPGFKDCHAKQYAQAQKECAGVGLANDMDCIGPAADSGAKINCGCKPGVKASTPKKVTTTTVTPDAALVEPEPTFLGLPVKTVAMIGLLGVGAYIFMQPKKGSKS